MQFYQEQKLILQEDIRLNYEGQFVIWRYLRDEILKYDKNRGWNYGRKDRQK